MALTVATAAHADDGVVSMTWDGCTGPVDKTPVAGGIADLYLTVSGIDQLHQAYDVRVYLGNTSPTVPDAWRFDAAGCQANSGVDQEVSVQGACPAFMQTSQIRQQIRLVKFPNPYYEQPMVGVLLANLYEPVDTVNPATIYLLERIRFDLTHAVAGAAESQNSCGGLEQPMCFLLSYAAYLDLRGNEIQFGGPYPGATVTANDPLGGACAAVPARSTTWGAIKSQYRN